MRKELEAFYNEMRKIDREFKNMQRKTQEIASYVPAPEYDEAMRYGFWLMSGDDMEVEH
jgi:hypothetical protein